MASTPAVSSSSIPALTAPGIGSGLDVNSIVSQLMAVEQQPLTLLGQKEASYQAKLSAYGALSGALASMQSAMAALATPDKFNALNATSGDSTIVSATASNNASAANYSIDVQTLAQAHKLMSSSAFAATSDTLGSGTLTIQFGTYSGGTFTANANKPAATIQIGATQNSLAGVRDAINAANAGVSASIVNDGTGNRLVISSTDSGVANALRISAVDDDGNNIDSSGLSALAYDASTGGTANLTQTIAAQNAAVVIDGISISKASNTITDAIEGVTLNLTNKGATSLAITRNSSAVQGAVQGFVKAYNDLHSTLQNVSGYNADTKQGSVLQGDSAVLGIESRMRSIFNTALVGAGGGLTTLSDIGVTFQKDGTLSLDSSKLAAAVADPTKDVSTLFAAVGKPTDSLIAFGSAATNVTPGSYAVNVTRLATRGAGVGSIAAATTITAGVNDTLSFTVDGANRSATLAAGNYSASGLAAAIQSALNGALKDSGVAVTMTQSGGVLTVLSNSYGASSTVALVGGTALAGLFGTPSSTAGLDAAGTIGGVAATGAGQTLTANGLSVQVLGGATGSRGSVKFSQGYAYQLNQAIDGMIGSDGLIASYTAGVNSSIKDIDQQRDALNQRLATIEANYRAQFTALDQMIASMNSTSTFLTSQLAAIPKPGSLAKS